MGQFFTEDEIQRMMDQVWCSDVFGKLVDLMIISLIFPVSFLRSVCLYVLFLIVVLLSLSFQADEDHSGSLEYEEFMQIVTGKKSSSSSDKR